MVTRLVGVAAVSACCLATGAADGALITLTHSGTGEGTIGATSFGMARFTITAIGETGARTAGASGVLYLPHTTAHIDIEGLGTFAFVTSTRSFVNPYADVGGGPTVGFSRGGDGGGDLFTGPLNDPRLATWDLTTSIGPVTGTAQLYQWTAMPNVVTSGGVLVFNAQFDTTATFAAVVAPSPGAIGLLAVSSLLVSRRRREGTAEQRNPNRVV